MSYDLPKVTWLFFDKGSSYSLGAVSIVPMACFQRSVKMFSFSFLSKIRRWGFISGSVVKNLPLHATEV